MNQTEESRKRAKSGCSMKLKSTGLNGKNAASESSEEVEEDDDYFEISKSILSSKRL
jgi:hypothetical protein